MAIATVPTESVPSRASASQLTTARAEALDHAACEITALAQALTVARADKRVHSFDALLTGALMRIELLGTCVGVLADQRTDFEEVVVQYDIVLGKPLEVSDD